MTSALTNYFGAVDVTAIAVVVAALLGGGLLSAVVAFRKAGPEAGEIVAQTLIQVNDHLREELSRLRQEHAVELGQRDDQIAMLRERVALLESEMVNAGLRPIPPLTTPP